MDELFYLHIFVDGNLPMDYLTFEEVTKEDLESIKDELVVIYKITGTIEKVLADSTLEKPVIYPES